jgi:hypothetical protein
VKPLPVIVTVVPPAVGPDVGEMLVIVGAAVEVDPWKISPAIDGVPGVALPTPPLARQLVALIQLTPATSVPSVLSGGAGAACEVQVDPALELTWNKPPVGTRYCSVPTRSITYESSSTTQEVEVTQFIAVVIYPLLVVGAGPIS